MMLRRRSTLALAMAIFSLPVFSTVSSSRASAQMYVNPGSPYVYPAPVYRQPAYGGQGGVRQPYAAPRYYYPANNRSRRSWNGRNNSGYWPTGRGVPMAKPWLGR